MSGSSAARLASCARATALRESASSPLSNGVNAFVSSWHGNADVAARARESDARLEAGRALSTLDGATFASKANFAVDGAVCTAGSAALEAYVPTYTATAVQRLVDAGLVHVGITNMDEFGMGSCGLILSTVPRGILSTHP